MLQKDPTELPLIIDFYSNMGDIDANQSILKWQMVKQKVGKVSKRRYYEEKVEKTWGK